MRNTQWTGVIKMTFYEWSLRYGRRCQIFSIVTDILIFVFSEIKNNLISLSLFMYSTYVTHIFFLSLSLSMYSTYVTHIFLSFSLSMYFTYVTHIFFLSMYFTYVTHIFFSLYVLYVCNTHFSFLFLSLCTLRM
jgi:hypothetical protein